MRNWKPLSALVWTAALAGVIVALPHYVRAQVSKGQQILLDRGLQIQSLATSDNYFHLDTYSNANFTSIDLSLIHI